MELQQRLTIVPIIWKDCNAGIGADSQILSPNIARRRDCVEDSLHRLDRARRVSEFSRYCDEFTRTGAHDNRARINLSPHYRGDGRDCLIALFSTVCLAYRPEFVNIEGDERERMVTTSSPSYQAAKHSGQRSKRRQACQGIVVSVGGACCRGSRRYATFRGGKAGSAPPVPIGREDCILVSETMYSAFFHESFPGGCGDLRSKAV
jgi:hypothetical protein